MSHSALSEILVSLVVGSEGIFTTRGTKETQGAQSVVVHLVQS